MASESAPPATDDGHECPSCGQTISRCPSCGDPLWPEEEVEEGEEESENPTQQKPEGLWIVKLLIWPILFAIGYFLGSYFL